MTFKPLFTFAPQNPEDEEEDQEVPQVRSPQDRFAHYPKPPVLSPAGLAGESARSPYTEQTLTTTSALTRALVGQRDEIAGQPAPPPTPGQPLGSRIPQGGSVFPEGGAASPPPGPGPESEERFWRGEEGGLTSLENRKISLKAAGHQILVGLGFFGEKLERAGLGELFHEARQRPDAVKEIFEGTAEAYRRQNWEAANELLETDPNGALQYLERLVLQTLPVSLVGAAASAATGGGFAVGMAASAGAFYPVIAGGLKSELEDRGLDSEEAEVWATAGAIPLAAMESVIGGLGGRVIGRVVREGAENTITKGLLPEVIERRFMDRLYGLAKEMGIEGISEGITEAIQAPAEMMLVGAATDDMPSVQELAYASAMGAWQGAFAGAALGGGFGVIGEAHRDYQIRQYNATRDAVGAEIAGFDADQAPEGTTLVDGTTLRIATNGRRMWFKPDADGKLVRVKKPTPESLQETVLGKEADATTAAETAKALPPADVGPMNVPIDKASADLATRPDAQGMEAPVVALNIRNLAASFVPPASAYLRAEGRTDAEVDATIASLEAIALDPSTDTPFATRVTAMARKEALEYVRRSKRRGRNQTENLDVTKGARELAALDGVTFNGVARGLEAGGNPQQLRMLQEARALRALGESEVPSQASQVRKMLAEASVVRQRGLAPGQKVTTKDGQVGEVVKVSTAGELEVAFPDADAPISLSADNVNILPDPRQTVQLTDGSTGKVEEVSSTGIRVTLDNGSEVVLDPSGVDIERVGGSNAVKRQIDAARRKAERDAKAAQAPAVPLTQPTQAVDTRTGQTVVVEAVTQETATLEGGEEVPRATLAPKGQGRTVAEIRESGQIPTFEPGTQPSGEGRHINFVVIPEDMAAQFEGAVKNSDVSMSAYLSDLGPKAGVYLLPQPPRAGTRMYAVELPSDARTLTDASKKALGFLSGKVKDVHRATLTGRVRISRPLEAEEVGLMRVPEGLREAVDLSSFQNMDQANQREYMKRLTDLSFGMDAEVAEAVQKVREAMQEAADARIDGRIGHAEMSETSALVRRVELAQVITEKDSQVRRSVWDQIKMVLYEGMNPRDRTEIDVLNETFGDMLQKLLADDGKSAGIGPKVAERIEALRAEKGGRFQNVSDLLEIKGIAGIRFERIEEALRRGTMRLGQVLTKEHETELKVLLKALPGRKGREVGDALAWEHPSIPGMTLVIDKETIDSFDPTQRRRSIEELTTLYGEEAIAALEPEQIEALRGDGSEALGERDVYHIKYITPDGDPIHARTIGHAEMTQRKRTLQEDGSYEMEDRPIEIPAHLAYAPIDNRGYTGTPPGMRRIYEGMREGKTLDQMIDELRGERRQVERVKLKNNQEFFVQKADGKTVPVGDLTAQEVREGMRLFATEATYDVVSQDGEYTILRDKEGNSFEIPTKEVAVSVGKEDEPLVAMPFNRRLTPDEVLDEVARKVRGFHGATRVLGVGEWRSQSPGVYASVRERGDGTYTARILNEPQEKTLRRPRLYTVDTQETFASKAEAEAWLKGMEFRRIPPTRNASEIFAALPELDVVFGDPKRAKAKKAPSVIQDTFDPTAEITRLETEARDLEMQLEVLEQSRAGEGADVDLAGEINQRLEQIDLEISMAMDHAAESAQRTPRAPSVASEIAAGIAELGTEQGSDLNNQAYDIDKVENALVDVLQYYRGKGYVPQPVRDYAVDFALRHAQRVRRPQHPSGVFGDYSLRKMLYVFETRDLPRLQTSGDPAGVTLSDSPDLMVSDFGSFVAGRTTAENNVKDARVIDGIVLDRHLEPTDPARLQAAKEIFENAEHQERFFDMVPGDIDASYLTNIADRLVRLDGKLGVVTNSNIGSNNLTVMVFRDGQQVITTIPKGQAKRVRNPRKALDYYRSARDALGEMTNAPVTPEMGLSPRDRKMGLDGIVDREAYVKGLATYVAKLGRKVNVSPKGKITGKNGAKNIDNLVSAWIRMKELGISRVDLDAHGVSLGEPLVTKRLGKEVGLLQDLAFMELNAEFSPLSPFGHTLARAKLGLLTNQETRVIEQQAKEHGLPPDRSLMEKVEFLIQNSWDPNVAHTMYQTRRDLGMLAFFGGKLPPHGLELRIPATGASAQTGYGTAWMTFPRTIANRSTTFRVFHHLAEKARTQSGNEIKDAVSIIEGLQTLNMDLDKKMIIWDMMQRQDIGDAMANPRDILPRDKILEIVGKDYKLDGWDWYTQYAAMRRLAGKLLRDNVRNGLVRGFKADVLGLDQIKPDGILEAMRIIKQENNMTPGEAREIMTLHEQGRTVYNLDRTSNPAYARPRDQVETFLDLIEKYDRLELIPEDVQATMAAAKDKQGNPWMIQEFDFWARYGINNYAPKILQGRHKILMPNPEGGRDILVAFAPDGETAQEFFLRVHLGQVPNIPRGAIESMYIEYGPARGDDLDMAFLGNNRFAKMYTLLAKEFGGKDGKAAKLAREAVKAIRVGSEPATPRDLHMMARTADLSDIIEDPYRRMVLYAARTSRNNMLLDIEQAYETAVKIDPDVSRATGEQGVFMNNERGVLGQGAVAEYIMDLRDSYMGKPTKGEKVMNKIMAILTTPMKLSRRSWARIQKQMSEDPNYSVFTDPEFIEALYNEDYAARSAAQDLAALQSVWRLGWNFTGAGINSLQHMAFTPSYMMSRGATAADAAKFSAQGIVDAVTYWKATKKDPSKRTQAEEDMISFIEDVGVSVVPGRGVAGPGLGVVGEGRPTFFSDDSPWTKGGKMIEWALMLPFASAERSVRLSGALASKHFAEQMKLSREGAVALARDVIDNTQFQYYDQALPPVMRGSLARVLFQFQQFPANAVKYEKDLILGMLPKGLTPQSGRLRGQETIQMARSGKVVSARQQAAKAALVYNLTGLFLGGLNWFAMRPVLGLLAPLANHLGIPSLKELLFKLSGAEDDAVEYAGAYQPDVELLSARDAVLYGAPALAGWMLSDRMGVSGLEIDPSSALDLLVGPTGSMVNDFREMMWGENGYAKMNKNATYFGYGAAGLTALGVLPSYRLALLGNTFGATAAASLFEGVKMTDWLRESTQGKRFVRAMNNAPARGITHTANMYDIGWTIPEPPFITADFSGSTTGMVDANNQLRFYSGDLNKAHSAVSAILGAQTVNSAEERALLEYFGKQALEDAEARRGWLELAASAAEAEGINSEKVTEYIALAEEEAGVYLDEVMIREEMADRERGAISRAQDRVTAPRRSGGAPWPSGQVPGGR